MSPRTTLLIAMLATTAVLAGCTTTATGTPQPAPGNDGASTSAPGTSGTSPTSSEESEQSEAPRVDNPLDVSPYLADPCSTLTPEQVTAFGVTRRSDPREQGVTGPGCTWHGDPGSVGIGFLTGNEEGLSDTYKRRELDAYFIETTVDGYPAVFVDSNDGRAQGYCGIVVGTSDTLSFAALEQGSLDADGACARIKQVAAAAIATMKAGA